MVDIGRSFPNMIDTLNDSRTRFDIGKCLVNISVSDERRENRIKAIYMMGQYAFYLGVIPECHSILYTVYIS
jgi:peptidoglycan hydrolase CwlO-like protein